MLRDRKRRDKLSILSFWQLITMRSDVKFKGKRIINELWYCQERNLIFLKLRIDLLIMIEETLNSMMNSLKFYSQMKKLKVKSKEKRKIKILKMRKMRKKEVMKVVQIQTRKRKRLLKN